MIWEHIRDLTRLAICPITDIGISFCLVDFLFCFGFLFCLFFVGFFVFFFGGGGRTATTIYMTEFKFSNDFWIIPKHVCYYFEQQSGY